MLVIKWKSKMKTNIELLIAHLRKEKSNLEKEMNFYVGERAFEEAQYFVKPLRLIEQKLNVLRLIEPSNLLEIENLKRQIQALKKHFGNKNEIIEKSIWRRIEQLQIKIIELQQPSERKTIDSPIIDDAIFELLNLEYSILKFHLENQEATLELSLISKSQLLFSFKSFHIKGKPFWESWFLISFYKNLGFEKNDLNSTFDLKLELGDFSFIEIKSLLAYIFFEGIISPRKSKEQYFIEKI